MSFCKSFKKPNVKCIKTIFTAPNHQRCRHMSSGAYNLNLANLNPHVKIMEYAVRGPLMARATELENELKKGVKKPFTEVIKANLGNCHALGQRPITFLRQVLVLVTYPKLLDDPQIPEDAKTRAKMILEECPGGSAGSYTLSAGLEIIRKHVAKYIEKRDGIPSDWENVFLSSGASDSIKNVLKLLNCTIDGKKPGVMVCIPQYPLYSATLTEFDMHQIWYFLDESRNWELTTAELQRAIHDAKEHCHPRALVVINPGNPTGQVLSKQNIEEIVKFAHKEKLFLLADEVYQDNIYAPGSQFHAMKKVMTEMGPPYSTVELASFMSCSKGFLGECGLRGGYVEFVNMDPEVKKMYTKLISVNLCPSVLGQSAMFVCTTPPNQGEPSHELFIKEKTGILDALKLKAKMAEEAFTRFEGFSCNPVQGALYAFPQLHIPPKAVELAKEKNQPPDVFYASELLEQTGICVTAGSGFGQKPGTYHFRTTILPPTDKFEKMLEKFREFHEGFMAKYG